MLAPNSEEECSYDFFNIIVSNLSDASVGLGFITTAIILLLSVYLLYCAWYGNQKLGIRFVIYTYSPISPRETLYNNICYNVFLCNLWSTAIIQLLIQAFKKTLTKIDSTWYHIFYERINNLAFHHSMYKYSVYIYGTLAISFAYLIYTILSPSDLKSVIRQNERKMKTYMKFKEQLIGNKEPLVEK